MRRLILVRHAKSDRGGVSGPDLERPLSLRGDHDAPKMAQRLQQHQSRPDALYCSVARRACDTARYFVQAFDLSEDRVHFREDLYTFSAHELVQILCELDDACKTVGVIGHNPAISAVTAYLTGTDPGDLPTCTVVRIEVNGDSWQTLAPRICTLIDIDTPKDEPLNG